MGALAPFYLAGLAALSLPLLLHLVRRTPRFRQQFSSLMFLKPTPPRLTRRSRLDQWLLLLMRLAALALLAAAFCRPFLRETALLTLDNLPARRIVLLVDVSASMRRGDLWQQAIAAARKELDELGSRDEAALLAFHYQTETLVGFDDAGEQSGAARTELLRKQLESLKPSWGGTDLGVALATSAAMLESAADLRPAVEESQIVLISDVQQGSRFSALQAVTWPERVRVVVRPVVSRATTNARLHLVQNEEATGDEDARVRVVNASNSTTDQFFVRWSGGDATNTMDEVAVFVPPGQSRVVRLPRSTEQLSADRIELRGDDHDFDNRFYVVPRRKQNVHVLYVGDDSERDPQGLQYYLRLALDGDPLRNVTVQQ
ncbi:MAG TPA: BatA domain-containing protein, partial [Pirellulaceae bacterium]|nr:BatA domain-containing protein [Pirellulaceae bacterium]